MIVALACGLALGSCSGNSSALEHATAPVNGSQLAELAALPTPAGVDPATFEQLKAALAAILRHPGNARNVSAPPTMGTAAVDDLDITLDAGQAVFTWTYRNPGDYNQDGLASINDISVLGRYLGRTSANPDWDAAQVADGDGNGVVSISDLAPLGAGIGSVVEGYHLRYTSTPQDDGSWQLVSTMQRAEGAPGPSSARLHFSVSVDAATLPTDLVYFQVVPFEGADLGIGSNSVTLQAAPPVISSVTPLGGKADAQVTFSAEVFGDKPLSYAWDFGGGATPNARGDVNPTVRLNNAGTYSGTLTVSNAVGDDTFQFAIVVAANTPPSAVLTADPSAGLAPLAVTLDATGSTDADGSIVNYEFDFDGNGKYDQSGAEATAAHTYAGSGDFKAKLRVTDDSGLTATATATVSLAALPTAVITANSTQVVSPGYVTLEAQGSSSPNGAIVKYEWDWDGNGVIDADSKSSAFLRALFDAPPGTYQSAVRVTDVTGAQNTASIAITVTGATFIAPPVEQYRDGGGSGATHWLKSAYATLPEWRDANGPYQSGFFAMWADQVFMLINGARVANGLPPFVRDEHLDLLSQAHERDQALRGYFNHVALEGIDWQARFDAVQPPRGFAGEIIGQGAEDPNESVQLWMASPHHKDIILNSTLELAGVGVYWKSNGLKGLECYWGVVMVNARDGGPEQFDGHDWLEPQEVH